MQSLRSFLLSLLLLATNFCIGQKPRVRFDHIGVEQGLSDNVIIDALQDDNGTVWLATAHGLNRFDGRYCKVFSTAGSELLSLDHVNNLILDHNKKLWISTYFKGLYYYDLQSEIFTHVVFPDSNATIFNYKNSVRQVIQTSNHEMWALSVYGIARYLPKIHKWKWYTQSLDSFVFTRNNGNCMLETKDSVLFVGFFNFGQLFYFDEEQDGFRVFKGKSISHKPITKSVISILDDSYGNLWYGSDEAGLVCYNYKNDTWKKYCANASPDSLQANEISSLFEDSEHTLWIGTINGGLSRFDRKKKAFTTFKHDDLDENSLSSNSTNIKFEDKDHNLIITTSNGLNILNRRKNLFAFYGKTLIGNKIISQNQTSAFYESPDGTVWIGTDGQGLQSFNPKTGQFKIYNTSNGFPSNIILKIEPNGDGKLWLATWSGGLILFNPKTGITKVFTPNNSGFNSYNIKGLCKIGNYLWIGTHGNGLNIYDCKLNIFYNKEHPSKVFSFNMSLPVWINDVFKDSYGDIWISTTFGLYHLQGNTVYQYKLTSISGFNIRKVFEDSKRNLWICSNGLDLYNRSKNSFMRIDSRNKDLPNTVNAIEEDIKGRLWLSSNDGLYCYDTRKNLVERYTESDGIQGNRFIERASLKTKDGLLYFGGYSGFNVFDPLKMDAPSRMPKVIIRSCKNLLYSADNTKSPIQMEFIHKNPIKIPFNQSQILTFEYAAPTLQTPEIINYTTHLIGFENEERQLGKQTSVTYTNLAPGKYTLFVRAYNSRHREQSTTAELHFTILSPWYMTLIFKLSGFLTVATLITMFFYFRTRLLARRNVVLSNLVKERTVQLEEQNAVINIKNKDLYEIIKTRDKLLAIISHDLRNPINVLCGLTSMIEMNYDSYSEDKRKSIIKSINKSSESVKYQVLNLLDWALTQSGKVTYVPVECNIASILRDEVTFLLPFAEQKGIKLNLNINIDQSIFADIRMVSTVIRNLISNGIKFSYKSGDINISAIKSNNVGIISIQDFGVGIDGTKITQFFNNKTITPTTGTENEKGTGLGLLVCKEFIEKNKGTIDIISSKDKGTTIIVSFPLGKKIFTESNHENIEIQTVDVIDDAKHVLIVEDNIDLSNLIQQTLSTHFEIESAQNGKIGFEKALQNIPDIILSDIDMPEMNGIELCKKLKNDALTNHIPIIFISANDSVMQQIEGFQLGVDDYIVKPFNLEVLKAKITTLLQNRQMLAQHIRMELLSEPNRETVQTNGEMFLETTVKIIEEHISSPELNVEFIAVKLGYSRQQFYRKLKAIVGQSPIEFLTSYRLKKAKNMLLTNRYRISEIAYELGFNEPKYFSNCFTKEFGKTPSQFIKESQETSEKI